MRTCSDTDWAAQRIACFDACVHEAVSTLRLDRVGTSELSDRSKCIEHAAKRDEMKPLLFHMREISLAHTVMRNITEKRP